MGRHAKGATRSRASVATVVVGISIIVVIAVGSWLSSRAQPAPTSSAVNGSAVVVSSPACPQGPGGTVVDVLLPAGGLVRTSLDACGYQEGQQVAVQYLAGDPTRVSPAGTDAATGPFTDGRLLPYGLGIVALLAIGAALAVWIDSRRSRRAAGAMGQTPAHHHKADPEDTAPADPADKQTPAIGAADEAVVEPRPGRHARQDVDLDDDGGAAIGAEAPAPATATTHTEQLPSGEPDLGADGRHGPLTAIQVLPPTGWPRRTEPWSDLAGGPSRAAGQQLSSVDLVFPVTSSLAASLHDELFTHRSVAG